MAFLNHVKSHCNLLRKSFDFKKITYVLGLNLFSGFLFFLLFKYVFGAITSTLKKISSLDLSNLEAISSNPSTLTFVQTTFTKIGLLIMLLLILSILIWNLSQLSSWLIIIGSDLFRKGYKRIVGAYTKFIGLNLLWFLIWLIPLGFISAAIFFASEVPNLADSTMAILGFIFFMILGVFSYFTNICYYNYAYNYSVFKSIGLAFRTGFGKLKYFIVPIIFSIIISLIMQLIISLIKPIMPSPFSSWVTLLFYLTYFAYMALYFSKIIYKVQKKYHYLAYNYNPDRRK